MSIEVWQSEKEEITSLLGQLKSDTAKLFLGDALRKLNNQITNEENRNTSELKAVIIDGMSYSIPNCFNFYRFEKYTLKAEDDVIYAIDKSGKLDKDGTYHWYHYAWIPNGHKFTKLSVRTLGKDKYGDRYYANTDHFKHPADHYSYQTRRLYPDNRIYKTYIEYVLKELGLLGKSKSN